MGNCLSFRRRGSEDELPLLQDSTPLAEVIEASISRLSTDLCLRKDQTIRELKSDILESSRVTLAAAITRDEFNKFVRKYEVDQKRLLDAVSDLNRSVASGPQESIVDDRKRDVSEAIVAKMDGIVKRYSTILQKEQTQGVSEAIVAKIDEVVKRYSMMLHDEHTQIYDAIKK